MINPLLIICPLFLIIPVYAESLSSGDYIQQVTKIEKPFELRDPFKPPRIKMKTIAKVKEGGYRNGIYTNIPSINELEMGNFRIVGILVGKERRAMAKLNKKSKNKQSEVSANATFILQEGMKIGQEQAELKAILPGGVVFVEKITNVYGQDEYLETVMPISQE